MPKRIGRLSFVALALSLLTALGPSQAPLQPLALDRGASGLGLALRRVGASGRVLYVTAHPDDEHNGVLVRLSRGLGLHVALLTVTRGEGGQNAIGPELADALGVLRTGELMALHRFDGVAQYFGRAYEFGYSFSVEETLEKWGHEATLGDVVRVVRAFRPDVILTLPLEGRGGGQHHQAVARLTREAFRAAADPARFPDQGLRAWQARKLYAGGVGGFAEALAGRPVHVATGVSDPQLGMTWQQLGSRARALHLCQGAEQLLADPGPAEGVYTLVDAEPAANGTETDILDGIDTSLLGLARFAPMESEALRALQARAAAARDAFDATTPERAQAPLAALLSAVRALRRDLPASVADESGRFELDDRLAEEEADVADAWTRALGIEVEARAEQGLVTPGESFGLTVSVWNHGQTAVSLEDLVIDASAGWRAERRGGEAGPLAPGQVRQQRFAVSVPETARISQPYWRRLPDRDRHELLVAADETLPWSPADVTARVTLRIGDAPLRLQTPAVFRYAGSLVGERRHVVTVVPELAVRVTPEIAPVSTVEARRAVEVHAFVRSESAGGGEATVRLAAPPGWSVRPAAAPLHFARRDEEVAARFLVTPPARLVPGTVVLRASAARSGREYGDTVQVVEYPHVERRQLVRPAELRLLALDVRTAPRVSVGYVMGSGDTVDEAIRGLGVPLTPLSADDLAFGDLSRFTTIVTGIRAYETRPDLRSYQARLMRWVEAGGHLVVQYNRAAFNGTPGAALGPTPPEAASPFAPYPAAVSSARISDETAPVRRLVPGHVLLSRPNRIADGDFRGWVQERAIQLLAAHDPHYTELLAATDPFPYNAGEKRGLLVDAAVGAGTWTYVGLVLFRELPAGAPGAWRLLANLVSRPRQAGATTRTAPVLPEASRRATGNGRSAERP